MKSQDQETKMLFAIVGIVIGLYSVITFAIKIYLYLCGADPQGIGLLFILVSILFSWLYGLSSNRRSFESKLKEYFGEKIAGFEKRLGEREREISWLKHSESRAKDEKAQIQRWVESLSNDVRSMKREHKKHLTPSSAVIDEAFREITTEVTG